MVSEYDIVINANPYAEDLGIDSADVQTETAVDRLARLTHFRELALRFLDGTSPQPISAIVIVDAILSFDGIDKLEREIPMRYYAYEFVQVALRVIEGDSISASPRFGDWMTDWNKKFGIKGL